MVSERDVFLAADQLLKQQGSEAMGFATERAGHLSVKGDHEGQAVWLRVAQAIRVLQSDVPFVRVHRR